ncbi:MAG: hypothetical protein ACR2PL_19065 [Dehalococcoidia bacterium]
MLARISRTGTDNLNDLANGQIVIVVARWLLILSGLGISLWSPLQSDLDKVRISLFVLLALAAGNFYLHAQILMRHPVGPLIVYAASIADILVISLLTVSYGGFDARIFVFYYPALIAFALAFPAPVTYGFTRLLLALYSIASLVNLPVLPDMQVFVQRLISLIAVAVVSNIYLHTEQQRS